VTYETFKIVLMNSNYKRFLECCIVVRWMWCGCVNKMYDMKCVCGVESELYVCIKWVCGVCGGGKEKVVVWCVCVVWRVV